MATLALGDSNYGLVRSLRDPSIPTFTLGATPPLAGKVRGTQLVVYIYISLLEFFEIVFKPLLSPAHDVCPTINTLQERIMRNSLKLQQSSPTE